MPKDIVSSFEKFTKRVPNLEAEKTPQRVAALKHYFSKGGIISIAETGNGWPKLLYPNKSRLKQQITSMQEIKKLYTERLTSWKKKFSQAKSYHLVHNVKKLKEPLYWKHMAKYFSNKDYRADVDSVKLPAHLVSDRRWKPMVEMFVNDLDYRKQLTETVEKSVVYKDNRIVAKFANDLRGFRMEQSNRQIAELEKKISEIDTDIAAMQEITKWASF